jgi:hypothetical protein
LLLSIVNFDSTKMALTSSVSKIKNIYRLSLRDFEIGFEVGLAEI